jgi:5-methylcytosine-specific restriction endonuclease McrA
MPIRAKNKHRYPKDWPAISLARREAAGWRCEWCGAANAEPHPITGSRVVLTVAHVRDPAPENVAPDNLAALCQRCHLNHDRKHHIAVAAENRHHAMQTPDLFDDSGA